MITPNYKELALEGKFLLLDVKQAEAAAHNRRSAAVSAASPSAPRAGGLLSDDDHVASLVEAMRGLPSRGVKQSPAGNTAADWGEIIAALNLGGTRAAARDEREQTQTNSAASASGQQSENHGWGDVFKRVANGA